MKVWLRIAILILILVSSGLDAIGLISADRYFNIAEPMSESKDVEDHPWRLDFGAATTQTSRPVGQKHFEALRLEASTPIPQLSYECISPPNDWLLITAEIEIQPSSDNTEFFDFAGALLSYRKVEKENARLGFLTKDPSTGDWTWFEYGEAVGQSLGDGDRRLLTLKFAIHRKENKWALGVDDLYFPNLDLLPNDPLEPEEGRLYILGSSEYPLLIRQVTVHEVSEDNLEPFLAHYDLESMRLGDAIFFRREGVIPATSYPARSALERKRILFLRGFDLKILDQDMKVMPFIETEKLGRIIVYGSGGPTPSFIRATAKAEFTYTSDLKYLKWRLDKSIKKENRYVPLKTGDFTDGIETLIPLRENDEDPPVGLRISVFIDPTVMSKATSGQE